MTVGMARNDSNLCHCEERSDAAIYFQVVQDESWIASPSARNDSGAARNDSNLCHCEE